MTTKRTPGPWQAEWPNAEGPRYVASAVTTRCTETAVCTLREDQQADARLIAAAPDLAEAAMPIAAIAERLPEWAMDENMVHVSVRDIRALAAALAKAEGQS